MAKILGAIGIIFTLLGGSYAAIVLFVPSSVFAQHVIEADELKEQIILLTSSVQQLVNIDTEDRINDYIDELSLIESRIKKLQIKLDLERVTDDEIEELGNLQGQKYQLEQRIINIRGN